MRTQRTEHNGQVVPLMPSPPVEQPPCKQGAVRGGGGSPVNHCGQNEKPSVELPSLLPVVASKNYEPIIGQENRRRAWCQQRAYWLLLGHAGGKKTFDQVWAMLRRRWPQSSKGAEFFARCRLGWEKETGQLPPLPCPPSDSDAKKK